MEKPRAKSVACISSKKLDARLKSEYDNTYARLSCIHGLISTPLSIDGRSVGRRKGFKFRKARRRP